MDQLRQPLLDAPTIEKGDYEYFAHPVSGGVPMLEPGFLHEIVIKIIRKTSLENVDEITTPTTIGIHTSTAVSLMTNIPLVIIRKREYGLDGEVLLHQQTDYSEGDMFINNVNEGDRVFVLDDALPTGGTTKAVLDVLDHIGTNVVDTVAIIKKAGLNEPDGSDRYIKTPINVTARDGGVVIVDEYGDD